MNFFGMKRNGTARQTDPGHEEPDWSIPKGPALRPLTLPNGETIQVVREDVMRAALAAAKARPR